MKTSHLLIITITFLLFPVAAMAQKSVEGLPDDLDTEKIIFLKYEQIEGDHNIPYAQRKRNKERNILAGHANKALKVEAKKYPFSYIISNRSEYAKFAQEGYKYVLENDMMNAYNYGEVVSAGSQKIFAAPMYLREIATGKRYELFTIKQNVVYEYAKIMKKFNSMVRKEYDL